MRSVIWSTVVLCALGATSWSAWSTWRGSAARRPASLADMRQEEILRDSLGQPGDPSLDALFLGINTKHFSSALPSVPVRWEPRLADVGALAEPTFTLEGMFGHVGRRSAILLNPDLRTDPRALERALCHEMVHVYLYSIGNGSTSHGPQFQLVLRRLSDEGAFEGVIAEEGERTSLRAWLDAESARLDAERLSLDLLSEEIARERADLERDQAALTSRGDVESRARRREAYNQRALDANARVERDTRDAEAFDREVRRYNLMLVYPDGIDEGGLPERRHGA